MLLIPRAVELKKTAIDKYGRLPILDIMELKLNANGKTKEFLPMSLDMARLPDNSKLDYELFSVFEIIKLMLDGRTKMNTLPEYSFNRGGRGWWYSTLPFDYKDRLVLAAEVLIIGH